LSERTDDPLVSVVTATYDMARFVGPAVASVLNQTYRRLQYIVIDDGSTDDTREVVRRFEHDPRLEYHYQENRGQTIAKNEGIRRSAGRFVCFLDGDNVWEPDKLALQVRAFRDCRPEVGVVYTDQAYIDDDGRVTEIPEVVRYSGRISKWLLFDNFVTFNSAMVRRECFDRLGMFDENLDRSIDYELWLRFSTQYEFRYLPETTVGYRIWEGQMSQDRGRRFRNAWKIMNDFIEAHPDLIDPRTARSARSHALTMRGRYRTSRREFAEATRCFLGALKQRPLSLFAWKSVLKMVLGAGGP